MVSQTAPAIKEDGPVLSDRRPNAVPHLWPSARDAEHREALLARIADNPHLPSPPGVVLQVLEKAGHLDCSPAELAAVIHRDPALCGRILKAVNSALYGLPRSVTSIDRAVALLGFKLVRSLVLSLSLPAMHARGANATSLAAGQPSLESFWKESVAGAIVAHELALKMRRANPEDDLVAGLLRDLGALALRQTCAADYSRVLTHSAEELVHRQCRLEEEALGLNHAEVSAFILRRWRLPEDITEAVRYHHHPERADELPRPAAERARLLALASRIAQLQVGAGGGELLRDIFGLAQEHYDLSEAGLTEFLEPLADKIKDFAALINLDIGACEHYPRILVRATEELVKLTVESSVDQLRILEQKQQAEQETRHWREQAHRLHHEAVRDALTGAFNRGCFEAELSARFRRARRRGTVLGLIFLDLDNFKGMNDRFGHLFGDRVLKEAADNLFGSVRDGDLVARYGGDEFCILVENTSPCGLRAMADRLWHDLTQWTIPHNGHAISIHSSIGAVLCLPRTFGADAAAFLAAADRAMYAAKTTGKNQVSFSSLLGDADASWFQEVERRLFSVWLAEQGALAAQPPGVGVRRSRPRFEGAGRWARRMGWLTAEQLRPLLRERRASGRCFDDIALERGALSPPQWQAILALQLEPPEELAASLVKQRVAGELAMRENLRKYYRWLAATVG